MQRIILFLYIISKKYIAYVCMCMYAYRKFTTYEVIKYI